MSSWICQHSAFICLTRFSFLVHYSLSILININYLDEAKTQLIDLTNKSN